MRNHAHFQAAGQLAERRAADIRKKLRTEPCSLAQRDDLELEATICEAGAFDLLCRGPRPAVPNPITNPAAQSKARRKAAQIVKPPVDLWREELAHIEARPKDRVSSARKNVLTSVLAAVVEREEVIARLLADDARLEKLNTAIGRVADLSDAMGVAA